MPFDVTNIPADTEALFFGERNLLEKGWIQHHNQTRNGVCILGALEGKAYLVKDLLLRAIEESGLDPEAVRTRNITAFNDRLGRTKEQVLAVWRRAIELSYG